MGSLFSKSFDLEKAFNLGHFNHNNLEITIGNGKMNEIYKINENNEVCKLSVSLIIN